MKKKFICTVCGYVHEGDEAPEKCPLCGAPKSKFKELTEEEAVKFVTEHEIGVAKGCSEEMIKDLNTHFMGECTEVGMYLAMSRQADREGYPEIAEAFKRYAFEEAEHASKFAELLGDCVWTRCVSLPTPRRLISMPSTIPFTKWLRTKLAMAAASRGSTTAISAASNPTLFLKNLKAGC